MYATLSRWFSGCCMLLTAFARLSIEEYVTTTHRGLACLYIAEFLILLIRSAARHISLEYTGVYFNMCFLFTLTAAHTLHTVSYESS